MTIEGDTELAVLESRWEYSPFRFVEIQYIYSSEALDSRNTKKKIHHDIVIDLKFITFFSLRLLSFNPSYFALSKVANFIQKTEKLFSQFTSLWQTKLNLSGGYKLSCFSLYLSLLRDKIIVQARKSNSKFTVSCFLFSRVRESLIKKRSKNFLLLRFGSPAL